MDLMLCKINFIMHVLAFLWFVCALILILIILMQKGRGGGLSGAFGGGMTGGILGSKTGDFLTWVTVTLVGLFLLLSITLAKFYKPSASQLVDDSAPVGQSQPVGDVKAPDTELPDETALPDETDLPDNAEIPQ